MPCHSEYYGECEVEEKYEKLTRIACELASLLPDDARFSKRAQAWVTEHKELDKKRLALEAEKKRLRLLRKSALAKLTEEEIEALGLRRIFIGG